MQKGMKIIIVANTTWNISNFRLNIISELLKRKYEVIVAAPIDDYVNYLEKYPQVKHFDIKNLSRKGKNPLNDLFLFLELLKLYKKLKPDIVLHYTIKPNIYGSLASRICGIKTISAVTGLGYAFLHNGYLNKIVHSLYSLALKKNSKVLFENQDDRIFFIKEKIIKETQGFSTKGCGVDIEHFKTKSIINPNGKIIYTFIGRLLYDKGVIEFVEAAKIVKEKNPNIEFHIVGEIDEGNPSSIDKEELLFWINNNIIKYKGFKRDVRDIIDASHCIILPSYREAIPRALTEAMSMSRPIITTNTAGCKEAVENGKNGYLVPLYNSEKIAEAALHFAALNLEDKQKMANYGYKKALSEFDDRIIADKIVNIIDQIRES